MKRYSPDEAKSVRDAVARGLYGKLFDRIAISINELLEAPASTDSRPTIGILDIFGFEDFETNSFEQLCINLANEQLQYFFNEHIFALELEEYTKEGVDIANISYNDNQPVLSL